MPIIGDFIDGIVKFVRSSYIEYGYFIVLIGALIKNTVPINFLFPIPASTILILGTVYANKGQLNLYLILLLSASGLLLGMLSNYGLGRLGFVSYARKSNFWSPLIEPYNKYLDMASKFLQKRGGASFLIIYFIGAFRLFAAILAGALLMRFVAYLFWSVLASLVWTLFFGVGGYIIGETLAEQETLVFFAALFVSLVFVGIGALIYRHEHKSLFANEPPTNAPTSKKVKEEPEVLETQVKAEERK
jgi:membrane protein DedA with SNARE-associated domain